MRENCTQSEEKRREINQGGFALCVSLARFLCGRFFRFVNSTEKNEFNSLFIWSFINVEFDQAVLSRTDAAKITLSLTDGIICNYVL